MGYSRDHLSRRTKLVGEHLSMGTKFLGPFVHGVWIGWGPFVQLDQSIGDELWGTKCPRTIYVWDQMCHSQITPSLPLLLIILGYFRTLSLKFHKATSKIVVFPFMRPKPNRTGKLPLSYSLWFDEFPCWFPYCDAKTAWFFISIFIDKAGLFIDKLYVSNKITQYF